MKIIFFLKFGFIQISLKLDFVIKVVINTDKAGIIMQSIRPIDAKGPVSPPHLNIINVIDQVRKKVINKNMFTFFILKTPL